MAFRLSRIFVFAISVLPGPCPAASPDDYEFPIGKIDQPIQCKPAQPKATDVNQSEEPACLRTFADVASRSGDTLSLKLDQGKTKTVKSNSKACKQIPVGPCVLYELVGYTPVSRQFVLRKSFYESVYVSLVSRRSGVVTELEGFPHLSPSGARFVTVAASDAWTINSPIAMFLNTDPPKLEWRFPQPHEYEEYSFDGWDGEDRVKVHTSTNPMIDTDITRSANGWILRRPNGKLSSGTSSPLRAGEDP